MAQLAAPRKARVLDLEQDRPGDRIGWEFKFLGNCPEVTSEAVTQHVIILGTILS